MRIHTRTTALLVLLLLLSACTSAFCGKIVYVKTTGLDTADGLTWATAKKTVQAAVNAATSGDEVWVAAGTYVQCIVIKPGVSLYGGFVGTETSRTQRAWWMNATVLDGGQIGSVVTCMSGVSNSTSIDGFTIRNGLAWIGGGIRLIDSSPTIANNIVTGNTANEQGGGIGSQTHDDSSAIIENNVITCNLAASGGGLCCVDSEQVLNNVITSNTGWVGGGGIYGYHHTGQISGNSIVGNGGGGIYNLYGAVTIANNIIAFNEFGLFSSVFSGTVTLQANCVYNPAGYNYKGIAAGVDDFSADPKLVSPQYGEVHLTSASPCIDAGDDSVSNPSWNDMDRDTRFIGQHVDIGADEHSGRVYAHTPVVIRVAPYGDDTNSGLSWPVAKRSIQAGIDAVTTVGGEVWVAGGQYYERITVKPYVQLYGHFAGTETSRDQRSRGLIESAIDGERCGTVVTAEVPGFYAGAIDGFTIRNGKSNYGGGINCSGSFVSIANNEIICNEAKYGAGVYGYYYHGLISGCIIENNIAPTSGCEGGGIHLTGGLPWVTGNTICRNTAASGNGGGIYSSGTHIINGNIIALNSAQRGGGLYKGSFGGLSLESNTIVENTATYQGGGVYGTTGVTMHNNIIAFNTSGIYASEPLTADKFRRNNVYGNTDGDILNYPPAPGQIDGISADPLFVDRAAGDYHLSPLSPCRDAGWNDAPRLPLLDFDGEGRVFGGIVDIGADEFWPLGTISSAKLVANGRGVDIDGAIVSAAFSDHFYIESDDRHCGIRVNRAGHSLQAGVRVHVIGSMNTSSEGERCIDASDVHQGTPPNDVGSVDWLGISLRSLGGRDWHHDPPSGAGQKGIVAASGLNNIGLLVRVWGEVTYQGSDCFYLDDGSGVSDPSGHSGVKVLGSVPLPPGENPATWDPIGQPVQVTGISCCYKAGEDLHRLIRSTAVALE